MEKEQKLINIYHNAPDIQSLCRVLMHDINSNFILISWYVTENLWYIPIIYDRDIEDTPIITGWYINTEPNMNTIPIRHTIFKNYKLIKFSNVKACVIYDSTTDVSNMSIYSFVLESFLSRLINEDLVKRNQYRQELTLSNICHSIRTPLNGILHMTDMLIKSNQPSSRSPSPVMSPITSPMNHQSGKSSPVQQQPTTGNANNHKPNTPRLYKYPRVDNHLAQLNEEHLTYLNQSVITLANNIFDIIDMTQLEIGKLKIVKDVFNIHDLISDVINVAGKLTKNKNVLLEYAVDPSVPEYAYSDAKRIKQILINLLENALQYTHAGEVILHVSAALINLFDEDREEYQSTIYHDSRQYNLSFIVRDSGIGMEEKTKNTIFRPPEIMRNSKQQGIGLRVSYLLSKRLDGNLSLLYSEPDKGSCFQLDLVVFEEEPPVINSDTMKSLKNKKILIVDDTKEKITICQVLDKYDVGYTLASSYEEILILHYNKIFDLIICKTKLSIGDGVDIAKHMHNKWSKTPILAITDGTENLPKSTFYDTISIPVEEHAFRQKLLTIINTRNNTQLINSDLHILVVEDEQVNRIVMEKLLRNAGYQKIDLVSSGEEALKLIFNNLEYYDILLLDIRMPLMTGFELADIVVKIYAEKKLKCPKIIGITAQLILDEEVSSIKEFIYKPIDMIELCKKIKELVH
jgi:signal transduction histidine kinase/DNA-binding response OmpR family regulator